jgi:hypothetical protein
MTSPHDGRPVALLAWELGQGLSYVHALRLLARALAAAGVRPVLALRNPGEAWPLLDGEPFDLLQAPYVPTPAWRGPQPFRARSYADVLALWGFASVETLGPRVWAWDRLLDAVGPRVVVCTSSPGLVLAAAGRVPVLEFGFGFLLPPLDGPTFPPLPDEAAAPDESALLAVVRTVQQRRGGPLPDTFPAAFAHAERFLTVLPELDPYRPARPGGHLGPVEALPAPRPWPERPAFFAYLNAEHGPAGEVLVALARTGLPHRAFLCGANAACRQGLRERGVTLADEPLPVADALAGASVVAHHGGVTLCQMALAAGRPQLLLPAHREHTLNARALAGLGVALCPESLSAAPAALGLLVAEPAWRERALQAAADVQARGPWEQLPALVARCRALLG